MEASDKKVKTAHTRTAGTWFKDLMSTIGSFFVRLGKGIINFFVDTGIAIKNVFVNLWKMIRNFFVSMYTHFIKGGWRTKLSHFIMGSGQMAMGRPIKGIIYLLIQIAYFLFMFIPGGGIAWLVKFRTLGDVAIEYVAECTNPPGAAIEDCMPGFITEKPVFKDNSLLIMLFSVATLVITLFFLVIYFVQVRGIYKGEKVYEEAQTKYQAAKAEGSSEEFKNPLPKFGDEIKSLVNERFHFTTLSLPTITLTMFTILPLLFMILLAFTNYNRETSPPNKLFTWVGLDTFKNLFSTKGASSTNATFGSAMIRILKWTFTWAFFATFTNYIFGLILAMIINRKSIKLKKVWRTIFVISIAVPQFVTLLLMNQLLKEYGPLNETLLQLGLIAKRIKFLDDPVLAKITVIIVNIWVGVPYTMLLTSGILMNIPTELYESARIDGAGPVRQFFQITMPYILFVTGPYLITQFIGNINNFNVIFFLTGGGPSTGIPGVPYGHTDILITWLYALTVGGAHEEYAIGSALGIFIFLISATITLVLYSRTSAAKSEGDFA
ncbi:MAG: Maltose transport system permease protein MalF [Tenericutes bacterium ADurb.Bin087]|nr:MAG: Maltose transport system permease protein MalF [Tenericutes bacterium ADurb.Bin087]